LPGKAGKVISPDEKKKRRDIMKKGTLFFLVIALIAGITGATLLGGYLQQSGITSGTETELNDNCPDDFQTTVITTLYNGLNDTGSESFDATGYIYQIIGDDEYYYDTFTDTTSGELNVTCGYDYVVKLVASNSDGGDNSRITEIRTGDATITSDGVRFSADKEKVPLGLVGSQHGVLTFRVFDNVDNRYAYDNTGSGDADNTVFEATGTGFRDGDNATAFAVGADGYVDFVFEFKGDTADEQFNDYSAVVFVEAPTNKWNEPVIKLNGKTLPDIMDTLTGDENVAFNDFEYAYTFTADECPLDNDINYLDFYMETCAGCDPTADLNVTVCTRGNYLSVDGVTVKQASAKDDSSHSRLYTCQYAEIDAS
jgi:hypothetical protein